MLTRRRRSQGVGSQGVNSQAVNWQGVLARLVRPAWRG